MTETVRDLLLSFAPVTALVAQRVYAQILPQSATLPAIRLQTVGQIERSHLRGPVDLMVVRMQVDSVALSKSAADAVYGAVHGNGLGIGLKNFRGTFGGVRFQLVQPDNRRDAYDAEELKQFKVMRDYLLHFKVL